MALAWIITTSFYILASLGSQGHMPKRIWFFLGGIVAISLGLHFAIRRYAPNASQVLLPIATLLNGIGYVEIARWSSSNASHQALWFLVSAIAVVITLKLVRHVRDLDRYRYLTLLGAIGLMLAPLVRTWASTSTVHACGSRSDPSRFNLLRSPRSCSPSSSLPTSQRTETSSRRPRSASPVD